MMMTSSRKRRKSKRKEIEMGWRSKGRRSEKICEREKG
jgi:hypothetical protein